MQAACKALEIEVAVLSVTASRCNVSRIDGHANLVASFRALIGRGLQGIWQLRATQSARDCMNRAGRSMTGCSDVNEASLVKASNRLLSSAYIYYAFYSSVVLRANLSTYLLLYRWINWQCSALRTPRYGCLRQP
jgi:hypothetical protein